RGTRDIMDWVDDRVGTDVCLQLPGAETLAGNCDRGAQVSSPRLDHGAAEPMIDAGERAGDGRAEAEAHGGDARRIRAGQLREQVEPTATADHVGREGPHVGGGA